MEGIIMKAFTTHTGIVATLNRANVDTDAIIPKQFLKSIKRIGYGPNAFFDWRYTPLGEPNPDFEPNQKRCFRPYSTWASVQRRCTSTLSSQPSNYGCPHPTRAASSKSSANCTKSRRSIGIASIGSGRNQSFNRRKTTLLPPHSSS